MSDSKNPAIYHRGKELTLSSHTPVRFGSVCSHTRFFVAVCCLVIYTGAILVLVWALHCVTSDTYTYEHPSLSQASDSWALDFREHDGMSRMGGSGKGAGRNGD